MNKYLIQRATQERSFGKNVSNKDMKKIMQEYEKSLVIPKKNKEQFIVCPVGLVGSGKSTVLKLINKRLNLLMISTDQLRKILMEKDYNLLRTKEIIELILYKYIKEGYSISVDADCVSKESQHALKTMCAKVKCDMYWIHINTPEKFVFNKLKNYKHTWLFRDSKEAIENYKRRKILHKLNVPKINFYQVFDTSKVNLKKQATDFVNKVKENQKV